MYLKKLHKQVKRNRDEIIEPNCFYHLYNSGKIVIEYLLRNEYLTNLILYIHCNPLELRKEIENYKYSSYRAIVSTLKTHVQRESVLEIFGGIENFIFCHIEKKV